MGNYCTRSQPEDNTTLTKYSVGKDYQELDDQKAGQGIKQTNAWRATITQEQLQAKREEFWNTRRTGRRRTWMVIRQACEADYETAALLLQMADITPLNNCMAQCIDSHGNKYDVPIFAINDPVAFTNSKGIVKKAKSPLGEEMIEIKLRLMKTQQDTVVQLSNMTTIDQVKNMFVEKNGEIKLDGMRLFFGGKVLKDDQTLASYWVQAGMVVQVLAKEQ